MGDKDYSGTPLYKKLGIKEDAVVLVAGAPRNFRASLGRVPRGVRFTSRTEEADVAVVFAREMKELPARFRAAAGAVRPAGRLWVAYPKKASRLAGDVTFDAVQRTGLDAGLVDNKSCAIDDDWSGVQFVYRVADRPKKR